MSDTELDEETSNGGVLEEKKGEAVPSTAALTRLARRAGVKSMSTECLEVLRAALVTELDRVSGVIKLVNRERKIKTVMPEDVYEALNLMGKSMAVSKNLGTKVVGKKMKK